MRIWRRILSNAEPLQVEEPARNVCCERVLLVEIFCGHVGGFCGSLQKCSLVIFSQLACLFKFKNLKILILFETFQPSDRAFADRGGKLRNYRIASGANRLNFNYMVHSATLLHTTSLAWNGVIYSDSDADNRNALEAVLYFVVRVLCTLQSLNNLSLLVSSYCKHPLWIW